MNGISKIKEVIEHDIGIKIKQEDAQHIKFIGITEVSKKRKRIDEMLTNFRNSPSFQKTHDYIEVLKKNDNLFDKQDKKDIIISSLNNSQIRWIIGDKDIFDYLLDKYSECKDILSDETKNDFEALTKKDNQTNDQTLEEIINMF